MRQVQLTIDLSGPPPSAYDQHSGVFTTRIIASVRGSEIAPIVWAVYAKIRHAITSSSARLFFNSECTRGRPCPPKSTQIKSLVPLRSLDVTCDPTFATVNLSQQTESEYLLSIQPNETLPAGPFKFFVVLSPRVLSGETLPPVRITVEGTIWEEVEALPTPLNLGGGRLGSVLEGTIVLRSRVMNAFSVESIVPQSDQTVVTLGESRKQHADLRVQQSVSATGHQQTEIQLTVRSGDGEPFHVSLP
ncbi:MAG: hypothetical protein ACC628_06540 [Pirellulaceae bacterium]